MSPFGDGGYVTMKPASVVQLQASSSTRIPMGGTGVSWPTPVLEHGAFCVAVFWYRCSHDPKVPAWFRPPHRLFVLDRESAIVLRSTNCSPADFGMDLDPSLPLAPPPKRLERPYEPWSAWRARLREISPMVWSDWAAGKTRLDAEATRRVAEYLELLPKVETEELMPFYEALGKDFFAWARLFASR
jgi:hypothetical protein